MRKLFMPMALGAALFASEARAQNDSYSVEREKAVAQTIVDAASDSYEKLASLLRDKSFYVREAAQKTIRKNAFEELHTTRTPFAHMDDLGDRKEGEYLLEINGRLRKLREEILERQIGVEMEQDTPFIAPKEWHDKNQRLTARDALATISALTNRPISLQNAGLGFLEEKVTTSTLADQSSYWDVLRNFKTSGSGYMIRVSGNSHGAHTVLSEHDDQSPHAVAGAMHASLHPNYGSPPYQTKICFQMEQHFSLLYWKILEATFERPEKESLAGSIKTGAGKIIDPGEIEIPAGSAAGEKATMNVKCRLYALPIRTYSVVDLGKTQKFDISYNDKSLCTLEYRSTEPRADGKGYTVSIDMDPPFPSSDLSERIGWTAYGKTGLPLQHRKEEAANSTNTIWTKDFAEEPVSIKVHIPELQVGSAEATFVFKDVLLTPPEDKP